MYGMGNIEDFANDVKKARREAGQPVPAACLWIYNSRHLHAALSLFAERGGELVIEAETTGGLVKLAVCDKAEALTAAARLAELGLHFNDNDPR